MLLFLYLFIFVIVIVPILACLFYLMMGIAQVITGHQEESNFKKNSGWKIILLALLGLVIIYLGSSNFLFIFF